MMIRTWVPQDIAAVAEACLLIRKQSEWDRWPEIETPLEDIGKWLLRMMTNPMVQVFVWEQEDKTISSVVGVSLEETKNPPFLRFVFEWCLWGNNKREIALLWKAAREWGKGRGAILAQRGTAKKHYQILKWEKL